MCFSLFNFQVNSGEDPWWAPMAIFFDSSLKKKKYGTIKRSPTVGLKLDEGSKF